MKIFRNQQSYCVANFFKNRELSLPINHIFIRNFHCLTSLKERVKKKDCDSFCMTNMKIRSYSKKLSKDDLSKRLIYNLTLHSQRDNIPSLDRYEECKSLLEKGADPNLKDYEGNSLLYLAILSKDKRMFDLLIKHGANPVYDLQVMEWLYGRNRGEFK